MREDKAHRIAEGKKPLLVFQNQIVSRNIIALVTAALQRAVNLAAFLINAEITGMRFMHIDAAQILLIWRVEQSQILVQYIQIFLFKDLSVLGIGLIAILIILTILGNLVDEEQG